MVCSVVTFCFLATAAVAAPRLQVGPVTISYKRFVFGSNVLKASGGVHMSATHFDLQADTMTVMLNSSSGPGGISRAVAEGDTSTGHQIAGRFEQVDEGRTVKVLADHAVYSPLSGSSGFRQMNDASTIQGDLKVHSNPTGKVVFTGNVTLSFAAPAALAEPSITHMDSAVVFLGPGPDYPLVSGGPGVTMFTPLH